MRNTIVCLLTCLLHGIGWYYPAVPFHGPGRDWRAWRIYRAAAHTSEPPTSQNIHPGPPDRADVGQGEPVEAADEADRAVPPRFSAFLRRFRRFRFLSFPAVPAFFPVPAGRGGVPLRPVSSGSRRIPLAGPAVVRPGCRGRRYGSARRRTRRRPPCPARRAGRAAASTRLWEASSDIAASSAVRQAFRTPEVEPAGERSACASSAGQAILIRNGVIAAGASADARRPAGGAGAADVVPIGQRELYPYHVAVRQIGIRKADVGTWLTLTCPAGAVADNEFSEESL